VVDSGGGMLKIRGLRFSFPYPYICEFRKFSNGISILFYLSFSTQNSMLLELAMSISAVPPIRLMIKDAWLFDNQV